MGKVEKLIVLSVLLLIAVILVVSLTMDDPLRKENLADATPGAAKPATLVDPAAAPVADAAAPSALLSTNVAVPPPAAPAPQEVEPPVGPQIPAGSILKTNADLEDSYLADMKFYAWQEGDTFRGVAHKFYGDFTKLTILRRANEGRGDIKVGDKILVPVFDLDAAPPVAGAATAAAAPSAATAPKPKTAGAQPKATEKSAEKTTGNGRAHIVKEGESLWKIAKQELGAGSRWNEIYEANRDVLSSPEALHTGQRLRIP